SYKEGLDRCALTTIQTQSDRATPGIESWNFALNRCVSREWDSAVADSITSRSDIPTFLINLGLRRPRLSISFWLLLFALVTPGLTQLRVDTSTDSVLDRSDGAWQAYQESQDRFGGDEILVAAFTGSRPYDPEVLSKVERLSEL